MIRHPNFSADLMAPRLAAADGRSSRLPDVRQSLFIDPSAPGSAESDPFARLFDDLGRFDPTAVATRQAKIDGRRIRTDSSPGRSEMEQAMQGVLPTMSPTDGKRPVEGGAGAAGLSDSALSASEKELNDEPGDPVESSAETSSRFQPPAVIPGCSVVLAEPSQVDLSPATAYCGKAGVTPNELPASRVTAVDGDAVAERVRAGSSSDLPGAQESLPPTSDALQPTLLAIASAPPISLAELEVTLQAGSRLPSAQLHGDRWPELPGEESFETLVAGWNVEVGSEARTGTDQLPVFSNLGRRESQSARMAELGKAFFAGSPGENVLLAKDQFFPRPKNVESVLGEESMESPGGLGMASATGGAHVPMTASPHVSDTTPLLFGAASVQYALADQERFEGEHIDRSAAGRAVAAATSLIETYSLSGHGTSSRVVLRFKLGSEDLAVRIGLINGQPTAEFQTRSAEVRDAVMREWHASVPADSPLRAQAPVFTSNFTAVSRDGKSGQQGGRSHDHLLREDDGYRSIPQREADEPSILAPSPVHSPSSSALSTFA